VSGRGGTFAAALATVAFFIAFDAVLSYVMWGVGFGMKDVQWNPLFSIWMVVAIIAAVFAARLMREHRRAVTQTAAFCAVLTVAYLAVAWFFGIWACGDGGGCHGILGGG
jgi:hypothetical protein